MRVTHLKQQFNADNQPCQDKNLTQWYPYSSLSRKARAHWERSGDADMGIWFSIFVTVGTLVMMVLYG